MPALLLHVTILSIHFILRPDKDKPSGSVWWGWSGKLSSLVL